VTDLTLPMNPLAFDDLVELGRAMIPTLAPGWTDHNAHDPGIMLMELLAWIAEAQMYSLSRQRSDERRAYANLLGVEPRGPLPARGLLWPADGGTGTSPISVVIDAATPAKGDRPDAPEFYASYAVQLTTAKLVRVESRYRNGVSHDWTRVNAQQSATFLAFGDSPDTGVRLVLTFELNASESPTGDSPLSIGFEVVNAELAASAKRSGPKLVISLSDANGERYLDTTRDTTSGLLESGVILLSTGKVTPEEGRFQLILQSATGGFERPPRIRRVGINVLPIQQQHQVKDEHAKFGAGLPNQQYTLEQDGLVFTGNDKNSVEVTIIEDSRAVPWMETDDLKESGPNDSHFELDPSQGILTFGNGVNGRVVPKDASIQVTYRVCAGSGGNVQPDVRWIVQGIAGQLGVNPEATTGGLDATSLTDLRDSARIRFDSAHPLVTARDVETAASSFTDLGVTRAVELPSDAKWLAGDRVLIVTGPHDDNGELILQEAPEFLKAVHSRIAPALPLGQRLQVTGPTYVKIRIKAALTSTRNTDPNKVRTNAVAELEKRLAVVTANGLERWPLGRPLSVKSVQGWLRQVPGVARIQKVELRTGNGQMQQVLKLRQNQLPSLQMSEADITVDRPAEGNSR
jgi:hypothetical protein